MDLRTKEIYDRDAADWIGARGPVAVRDGRMDRFAARLAKDARVADLGSGPGWYAAALRERGHRSLALDLSRSMLQACGERHPAVPRVCGDLTRLPFARAQLDGAFAINTYVHVPVAELPLALAHLHHSLSTSAPVEMTLANLERAEPSADDRVRGEGEWRGDLEFVGRLFSAVTRERAQDLLAGAGFRVIEIESTKFWLLIQAEATATLPDFVAPDLKLLICGLNPSLHAADHGVPFSRPGNRFWPAARQVGLLELDRDPFAAVGRGIGFTDLVKRPTARAAELSREEYTSGVERLRKLVRRYRPETVCFVGLEGWRRAVDRDAQAGWLNDGIEGSRAYLMPSTSGLNASSQLPALAEHLRSAAS